MDAFVEGELDEGARQGILEHARVCENCARELKLNGMLREALHGMDAGVVLPLKAQASWREAVKAEARRKHMGVIYKRVGAVAAACVLLLGVSAGLKVLNEKPAEVRSEKVAMQAENGAGDEVSSFAFIEPDGDESTGTTQPTSTSVDTTEMNASVKLVSTDISKSVDTIQSLVTEFNGYIGKSSVSDSSAYITAYIPSGELADFTDSLGYAGTVGSTRVNGEGGDVASVTITIKGE